MRKEYVFQGVFGAVVITPDDWRSLIVCMTRYRFTNRGKDTVRFMFSLSSSFESLEYGVMRPLYSDGKRYRLSEMKERIADILTSIRIPEHRRNEILRSISNETLRTHKEMKFFVYPRQTP